LKNGNWIPISKALTKELPKNRPYSKMEAAYSLQIDFDNGSAATIKGYSALWDWSRNKVRRFLEEMGVDLKYPKSTVKIQNQKGQIMVQIRDRCWTDKGQIRLIDSKGLGKAKDRRGTDKGQIRDRSRTPTIDPKPKPKPNPKENKKYIVEIISYLNQKAGTKYRMNGEGSSKHINARLNEGWQTEDFKTVIDNKCISWLNDPEMSKYLRPETLFCPKHFESYLNERQNPLQGQFSKKTLSNIEVLQRTKLE